MNTATLRKTKSAVGDGNRESVYRTRWLMAHNRMQALCHDAKGAERAEMAQPWAAYLAELGTAEEIAAKPA